jgi:hypothetical protein
VKISARAKDRTPTRTSTRTPHATPEDKSASRARSTCHHPVRPPIQAPIRTARLEATSAPIDPTRWRLLWDRLLAPPVPRDAIATPLAVVQTSTTKASPKNRAIGGGGRV